MTTFIIEDPDGTTRVVDARIVTCVTPECINENIPIEVADDPSGVVQCGPCKQWIIPPSEPEEVP